MSVGIEAIFRTQSICREVYDVIINVSKIQKKNYVLKKIQGKPASQNLKNIFKQQAKHTSSASKTFGRIEKIELK